MKKILALCLAVLMLTSALSTTAFAAESSVETILPETSTQTPAESPAEEQQYNVEIVNGYMEFGFAVASKFQAKPGETVLIRAFEFEYFDGPLHKKIEFLGWYTRSDIQLIYGTKTVAFFVMPESDVTIFPMFRTLDLTEYYDWESVRSDIGRLKNNGKLTVDMEDEEKIPDDILHVLAGKNAEVTFITQDCTYTIHGSEIAYDAESTDGYKLTYDDSSLYSAARKKIGNTELLTIRVNAQSDHTVGTKLHINLDSDYTTGYLYRVQGLNFDFVSVINLTEDEILLPTEGSGTYTLTYRPVSGTFMDVPASSRNGTVLFSGKPVPLSTILDGKLIFKGSYHTDVKFSEYVSPYQDISRYKYRDEINYICARGVMDGFDETSFKPNAGVSINDVFHAVARIRNISDSDGRSYCEQLDIVKKDYDDGHLLTNNELSEILTNFVNHLITYPKSFGAYSMSCFNNNAAAWVGARFSEISDMKSGARFDWNDYASRGEFAYILSSIIHGVVAEDYVS